MIARKKIKHRKGTERQKLVEKQGLQLARIRTESKNYSAEKRGRGDSGNRIYSNLENN
jgi:hypothetical protein